MAETLAPIQIGPEHHGMRMTLDEFARAEGRPGYIHELEQGVVIVVDVPGVPHLLVRLGVRNALVAYQLGHPGRVFAVTEGSDAALRMPTLQSERHPDISVYLSPPPTPDAQPWDYWTPELVIEIVSASSADRDYRIKREEYLKAGVKAYWIIDPRDRTATALTRHADQWQERRLGPDGTLTIPLLPGLEVRLATVFPGGA